MDILGLLFGGGSSASNSGGSPSSGNSGGGHSGDDVKVAEMKEGGKTHNIIGGGKDHGKAIVDSKGSVDYLRAPGPGERATIAGGRDVTKK